MDEPGIFDAALRLFPDLEPDLRRFAESGLTGDLSADDIERARLAWCELRAIRSHRLAAGHAEAYRLGDLEEQAAGMLECLAAVCRVPLLTLVQGDPPAWSRLGRELASLLGRDDEPTAPADKPADKTRRKLPTNPVVLQCVRYLQQRRHVEKPRRQLIIDFISDSGLVGRSLVPSLERQVRRYSWLLGTK